jgi:hypothetical protein
MEARMQKLQFIAQQNEIRPDWVARMRCMEGFSICLLCDDSGSMATPVHTGYSNRNMNPYGPVASRWSELQGTTSLLVQLATALDPTGTVDVFFLNRPPLIGVQDASQIPPAFASPPNGFTPLARVITQILQHKAAVLAERKLLLIIATDGQPTDDAGSVQIPQFLNLLMTKPQNMFVQIMACTDDEGTMAYLNRVDDQIPRLDVTDDYASEKKEILRAQGPQFHFTYGDVSCRYNQPPYSLYTYYVHSSTAPINHCPPPHPPIFPPCSTLQRRFWGR